MANVLTGNPLRIDITTGANVSGPRRVVGIAWVGIAAADDIATADAFRLTDSLGNIIIEKVAASAGDDLLIMFPKPMIFNGLIVTAIDGGVCYIYED